MYYKLPSNNLYGDEPIPPAEKIPAGRKRAGTEKLKAGTFRTEGEKDLQPKETTEQELVKLLNELFIG